MNQRKFIQYALLLITAAATLSCAPGRHYKIPRSYQPLVVKMETTGYCKCGKCCGWERNIFLQPVFSSGPNKGKPKEVGITASGTKADIGTIAADPLYYPFGTIMYIPGYGWGCVEDVGGAIKGQHIDLFFKSHKKALERGRKDVEVQIWKPKS